MTISYCPFYWQRITGIMTLIYNYIHRFQWDVITQPCPNINDSLVKVEVKYRAEIGKHITYVLCRINYISIL